MSQPVELPRWLDVAVLPAVNLALALLVAGIVVALVGFQPGQVLALLIKGAFGSRPASATRCTTPPPSSSPGWPWRWPSTAACSTSAAKARP
jgi:hypothetical protein